MADYVVGINNSVGGEMMVRDTGWSIEFWIKSGNSSSWDGELGWDGIVNNTIVGGTFNYPLPGGVWRIIAAWNVSYSQTINFNKTTNSGSSGLGNSNRTEMSVYISRSTVPPAPTPVRFVNIKHDSVRTQFDGQGDGGSGILEWQIAFGTNGSSPDAAGNAKYSTGGTRDFTNLMPGQYYSAWSRGRNAHGWGAWSAGRAFNTLAGCHIRHTDGTWKSAIPYVKVSGVWMPAVPYVKQAGVWQATTS